MFKAVFEDRQKKGFQEINWEKNNSDEVYQRSANLVYNNLLQNKSILRFFIDKSDREVRGDWKFLSLYLEEVSNMDKSRINVIKQVGDFIADSIRKSGHDRRLRQLEFANNYGECRNILRFVIKDRIRQQEKMPLFSLDDYVEHLFPESQEQSILWWETRDLLVFRIYEKLHDWLVTSGTVDEEDDTESTHS